MQLTLKRPRSLEVQRSGGVGLGIPVQRRGRREVWDVEEKEGRGEVGLFRKILWSTPICVVWKLAVQFTG